MRLELMILLIAGFFMANIYTDGKYMTMLLSWKKYYQMTGIAVGALMLYILLKKNPLRAKEIITTTNDYIKYLPIDKNTSNFISPILDFTTKQGFISDNDNRPILTLSNQSQVAEDRIMNSGKQSTKRSVSETKKKFLYQNLLKDIVMRINQNHYI